MDASTKKGLSDRQYSKRKDSALGIEIAIRKAKDAGDWQKIEKIIDELCDDYAYAVHQPYARNGGLIGLAAASIALEQDVAPYLDKVIPPVISSFQDSDARVRYYACESMYNIAKTCKGELLPWFNEIFDALAKLSADSESSVKNGAELLDRLIKDVISTSATSYVSILQVKDHPLDEDGREKTGQEPRDLPTAFSLQRFIPLLQERILVNNPWTRMFLVQWIRLLDEIPDLELVSYLPSFLAGLFRFLKDTNQDVVTATQQVLDNFLREIQLVAKVKRDLEESEKEHFKDDASSTSLGSTSLQAKPTTDSATSTVAVDSISVDQNGNQEETNSIAIESQSDDGNDSQTAREEWTPGQGVEIRYPAILEILITFIRDADEVVQLTALRWIDSLFDICASDVLAFVPSLLNRVLPTLASDIERVQQTAARVNTNLMEYILSLPDDELEEQKQIIAKGTTTKPRGEKTGDHRQLQSAMEAQGTDGQTSSHESVVDAKATDSQPAPEAPPSLDYEAAVNSLTLQFLNEHEATRVAALSWLIMLQQKAPQKVLAAHDGSFPALLKTLSDPSDAVVTHDLQLLCQISRNSDDSYFTFFMINLLKLFCTDRRLLETRGNLIIRQLCVTLGPERIYRIMADCLEKDEDVDFASIMVQNLNNNLITAPELADLRRKLRSWDTREGQTLFVSLFRAWCHNPVATIALCLLAQAYEQAYHLLQIFSDIEMSLNMLVQIDKLTQLIESPVFTYLRLQLLEPSLYPHLYKTLYGILMLLPQSAAFAALKNRLNSVSAIGYLHIPRPPTTTNTSTTSSSLSNTTTSTLRSTKIKDDTSSGSLAASSGSSVKWADLLDLFRATQEASRRTARSGTGIGAGTGGGAADDTVQGAARRRRLLFPGDMREGGGGAVSNSAGHGAYDGSNGAVTNIAGQHGGAGIGGGGGSSSGMPRPGAVVGALGGVSGGPYMSAPSHGGSGGVIGGTGGTGGTGGGGASGASGGAGGAVQGRSEFGHRSRLSANLGRLGIGGGGKAPRGGGKK